MGDGPAGGGEIVRPGRSPGGKLEQTRSPDATGNPNDEAWPVISRRTAGRSLLLFVGLAGVAAAQGEPKPLPAPRMGSEIRSRPFLMEPAVQREIGLTARQREAMANIEAEVQEAHQGAVVPPVDGEFDFNSMMGGLEEVARDRTAAIAKVLTPAQKARLQQIEWQREGWPALGRPEVAARLKLTRPQVEQVATILQQMQRRQLGASLQGPEPRPAAGAKADPTAGEGPVDAAGVPLPGGGPMNFGSVTFQARAEKSGEAIDRVRAESAKEVAQVLTADQRSAFDRLLGPPFDFKSLDGPGPAPGRAPTAPQRRGPAGKGAKKG